MTRAAAAGTTASSVCGRLHSLTTAQGAFEIVVPNDVPGFLLRANAAVLAGDLEEARGLLGPDPVDCVRRILEQDPTRTDILFILAKLLADVGDRQGAADAYRRILGIEPHAHVYDQLARLLARDPRSWAEAEQCSRLAHEALPLEPSFHQQWAARLIDIGRVSEGIEELRRAVDLHPDDAASLLNLLWYAEYTPEISFAQISEGYRRWARYYAPTDRASRCHANNADPDRRVRIGYISPNFRNHCVAYFLEPILDGHDRGAVELFGYGNVTSPDATTERLARKFDLYRDILGRDAGSVAARIKEDRIDILVEIAGSVVGHRLDVLALKPAPIQADFGGISTTGMPQIDYRITDALYDPPSHEQYYVERLEYLPGGVSCFRPPAHSPWVGPLPAASRGALTLGSFNSHAKISPMVLALWARILRELPCARMILQYYSASNPENRESLLSRFEQHGIARERIEIFPWCSPSEHLQMFNRVDLLLDTYPYNGGTTTLEGLWMGVPTLTLVGDRFVSRAGLSILHRVGLDSFVAEHPEAYVGKALSLSGQLHELAAIRSGLRDRMLRSPLCDARRVSRDLEEAYRRMWRTWCVGRP